MPAVTPSVTPSSIIPIPVAFRRPLTKFSLPTLESLPNALALMFAATRAGNPSATPMIEVYADFSAPLIS